MANRQTFATAKLKPGKCVTEATKPLVLANIYPHQSDARVEDIASPRPLLSAAHSLVLVQSQEKEGRENHDSNILKMLSDNRNAKGINHESIRERAVLSPLRSLQSIHHPSP